MSSRAGWWVNVSLAAPLLAILITPDAGWCVEGDKTPTQYAQDTDVFRLILQRQGFTFVHSFNELREPSRSLAIVLGDVDALVPAQFHEFIIAGGAALVATDRATSNQNSVLQPFGISVNGNYLWQDLDTERAYRGAAHCPLVEPEPRDPLGIFQGTFAPEEREPRSSVATNLPSYLQLQQGRVPGRLTTVAWLPSQCALTNIAQLPKEGLRRIRLKERQPFAVGGEVAKGRLLVLADQSIFINVMMQQTDNANLAFTAQCVAWLNGPEPRDRVLFLENGVARDPSDIKLRSLPNPPIPEPPSVDSLLGMADPILADLEEKDILNRTLVTLLPPDKLRRWLLYILTGGLIYYGLSRLRKGRHRVDPNTPLLAAAVARATPSDNPIEQRHRSLLESGNLWEPARMLSRQFFETMLGPEALNPKGQTAGRLRMPPFQVNRRGLSGWLLSQRVRRLWRFANVTTPQAVSIRQFRKLTRRIAGVKDAARQGVFRFSSAPLSVSR